MVPVAGLEIALAVLESATLITHDINRIQCLRPSDRCRRVPITLASECEKVRKTAPDLAGMRQESRRGGRGGKLSIAITY